MVLVSIHIALHLSSSQKYLIVFVIYWRGLDPKSVSKIFADIMLMLVLLKCTRDFAIFRAKHNMLHSLLVYRNDGVVQVLL